MGLRRPAGNAQGDEAIEVDRPAPRARDMTAPLLSDDELEALIQTDLPDSRPPAFTSGVNEFVELLDRVADGTSPADVTMPSSAVAVPAVPAAAATAAIDRRAALAELAPPPAPGRVAIALELTVLYAIVVCLEVARTGAVGSYGTQPHPYWLVVLPMAAARGLWPGLAAAVTGAALYTVGVVDALDARRPMHPQDLLEPLLFCAVAAVVGQFRNHLLRRYRLLWSAVEHLSADAAPFDDGTASAVNDVWLGTTADLGARLRLEDARCTHQGVVTSLILLQATDVDGPTSAARRELDLDVCAFAAGALRSSDSLYHFGYPGCWLGVLPDTTLQGARAVCQRLARRLTGSGTLGVVAGDAFAPDDDHPTLPSLLDGIAAICRSRSELPLDVLCPVQVPAPPGIGDALAFVRAMRIELDLAVRGDRNLFFASIRLDVKDTAQLDLFWQHIEQAHGRLLRSTDAVYRLAADHFAVVVPGAAGAVAFTLVGDLLDLLGARLPPELMAKVQHEVFSLSDMPGEVQRLIDRLSQHAQSLAPTPEHDGAAGRAAAELDTLVDATAAICAAGPTGRTPTLAHLFDAGPRP